MSSRAAGERACAALARGHEGLEELVLDLLGDAPPGVRHGHHEIAVFAAHAQGVVALDDFIEVADFGLARIEARAPEQEPSGTPRVGRRDEPGMKFRASLDFDRQERLRELRENPGLLAAIRERRATMNKFYESRGLTPDPDPYPELP